MIIPDDKTSKKLFVNSHVDTSQWLVGIKSKDIINKYLDYIYIQILYTYVYMYIYVYVYINI